MTNFFVVFKRRKVIDTKFPRTLFVRRNQNFKHANESNFVVLHKFAVRVHAFMDSSLD